MFLESSKDILYLALAFCALWFTVFVCWALWYVISILRDASNVVEEVHDRVRAIDETIKSLREKIEHSAGYLGMMATGVKAIIAYMERRKEKMMEKAEQTKSKMKKKVKQALEEMELD